MEYVYVICVIAIIIMIMLTLDKCGHNTPSDDAVGFWEADDLFKDSAGLSLFYIYVGALKCDRTHPSYVMMVDDNNNILISKPVKITISKKMWVLSDTDGVLPTKLKLIYDHRSGTIELYDNDTIYAKMVKNNKLSIICKPVVKNNTVAVGSTEKNISCELE